MRRASPLFALSTAGALTAGILTAFTPGSSAAPAAPAPAAALAPADDRLEVYTGKVTTTQVEDLVATGIDRHELQLLPAGQDGGLKQVEVEVVLSGQQAAQLEKQGVELEVKRVEGQTITQRADAAAAAGYEVWQKYAGPGGLQAELRRTAKKYPRYTKLVSIGKSLNGQDISAIKVTKDARKVRDGRRPSVLYFSAQHAREWITPEMTTRLLQHVLKELRTKPAMRKLVSDNELWFLPVANPDGYDFTFTEGNRLWRKNLRDNNGDGEITPGDGVDINRNFPEKWGYDNEGSSPNPAGETYRGSGPASEPETKALVRFAKRVRFDFALNYHSAAELLLYGTGFQVATPSPDDVIYEALAGTDAKPAVPGYDPDLSAELYTTNGDTNDTLADQAGVLAYTPEMATCESASDSVEGDEWERADCGSVFEFPDDERLVQAEFRKNIPFALSLARSAGDPDDPKSVVGKRVPNFTTDPFTVSLGSPQTVAVTAKRALKKLTLKYRIGSGKARTAPAKIWRGGERYGRENVNYMAEYRGVVRGARPGQRVRVWFTGEKRIPRKGKKARFRTVTSKPFTYRVQGAGTGDVLIVANEDYTGVNPTYPAGTNAPKYLDAHVAAVEAAGYDADTWDVDAQGVPHHLGALSHYDAVLWYLGDNRITQDPEDEITSTPLGDLPDVSVAERQQYLTVAIRDYLNEGGKLVHAGETAQYEGLSGISDAVGGLYYGLNGDPSAECVVAERPGGDTSGFFEDCLILADDFRQYYLGAFGRVSTSGPTGVEGTGSPLEGYTGELGGPVVEGANPLDEVGVFTPTSEVLPREEFPQFASSEAAQYAVAPGGPYSPIEGERYAGVLHEDSSYSRLTRTVQVPADATEAQLRFQASWVIEPDYDFLVVEARTAGGEDWTTLPEAGGATSTETPAECAAGSFLLTLHPFLETYLGEACDNPEQKWNALTGDSDGWQQLAYDLSAFAGSEVELSITYVSDPGTGGIGAFVDDTRVVIDGVEDADGFEGETSQWAPGEPPTSSPAGGAEWQIGANLIENVAATSTEDTLLLGFGLEQLASDAARATLLERALDDLIG